MKLSELLNKFFNFPISLMDEENNCIFCEFIPTCQESRLGCHPGCVICLIILISDLSLGPRYKCHVSRCYMSRHVTSQHHARTETETD